MAAMSSTMLSPSKIMGNPGLLTSHLGGYHYKLRSNPNLSEIRPQIPVPVYASVTVQYSAHRHSGSWSS